PPWKPPSMPGCESSSLMSLFIGFEPQANQVPFLLGLGMVDKRRAIVQDPAIVDEVHVAGLEGELDAQLRQRGNAIERIQRLALLSTQRLARLLLSNFDPVPQIPAQENSIVPGEDRYRHGRLFSGQHAAAAVHLERLAHQGYYLGILLTQPLMHRVGMDHLAQSARLGRIP